MTVPTQADVGDAETRLHIEALIGAYPNIADEDLSRLLDWLKREATSYDVAMLSARDDIRQGYERFRKDHIDRISPLSIAVIAIIMLLIGGLLYWLTFDI